MSDEGKTRDQVVAELRQQSQDRRADALEIEAKALLGDIEATRDAAVGYWEQGQQDDALVMTDELKRMENDLNDKLHELQELRPQQQQPQFTETELDLIRQYSPQDLMKPHWSGARNAQNGQPLTNLDAMYLSSQNAQRFGDRDSKAYKEALEVVGPAEKNGLPTADDVLKTINATSKYGRTLTPKEYNKGARELQQRKAKGDYQD
jgi:hypothetical protein